MANGNTPEREAYHQLFDELKSQEDAAGNRSLAKVLEKHPFPIYEASIRRFRMTKEGQSEDAQLSPGTDVKEFTVKVGSAIGEVLVAGFDLVWDVATAPIHLTLYPRIRHPVYKAVLARLAALSNKDSLPLADNPSNDEKEMLQYTQNMAETIPPENNQPPSDSSMPPKDTMPPTPPPPPEGPPPPLGPERPSHSPEREAFHQLMRDLLEVTEPALREDVRDRAETNGALTLTAAEAWHECTKTPWNLPKHLRNFDTALRGRDLGSLKMRFARHAVNNTIGLTAGRLDLLDAGAEAAITNPVTGMIGAAWEYLTDSVINYGTNFVVQSATDERRAHYASPLSRTLSTVANLFPVLRQFVNAPLIESYFRTSYNMPVAGIPVELLYRHANEMIIAAERDPRFHWAQNFMIHITGGYARGRTASQRAPIVL